MQGARIKQKKIPRMQIEADRDTKLWDTVMTKTKGEAVVMNNLQAWADT